MDFCWSATRCGRALWGEAEPDPGPSWSGERELPMSSWLAPGSAGLSTAYFLRRLIRPCGSACWKQVRGVRRQRPKLLDVAQLAKTEIALLASGSAAKARRFLVDHQARMFRGLPAPTHRGSHRLRVRGRGPAPHREVGSPMRPASAGSGQLHREFGFPSELSTSRDARIASTSRLRRAERRPQRLCPAIFGVRGACGPRRSERGDRIHEGTPMPGLSRRGGGSSC